MPFDRSRIIVCERIYNLRDFGGYSIPGAGRLRSGLLFRSGNHGEATNADLEQVAGLALSTVVDLRGGEERSGLPCRRHPEFRAEVISVAEETVDPALMTASRTSASVAPTSEQAREIMRQMYRGLPFMPPIVDLLTRYFEMLATNEGSSLVYCMAGKDRTGVAVALVHHLAGVHRDDLMADYMATNDGPGWESWLERTRERYAQAGVLPASEEALRTLLSVHPTYLESAWATISDRVGSVGAYLEETLGVNSVKREAILQRLLD